MKRIAACLSALLLALLVVAEVAASLAEAQVTITLSTGAVSYTHLTLPTKA